MIAAIAAVSRNGMIGLAGWLPWDIPEELAYFEEKVAAGSLVVGRQTYESMSVINQPTYVVSRQAGLALRPGCSRVDSVEAAILAAQCLGKPVFVIGGAMVYAAALQYCDRFFLTRIEADFAGDAAFPSSVNLNDWRVIQVNEREYFERKTGKLVRCRFFEYAQKSPVRLVA